MKITVPKNCPSIFLTLILACMGSGWALQAQSTGYYDNFEDGVADTLWKADHPATFGISEAEGSLHIAYNRTADTTAWDNFNFTPPEVIDVSANPVIIFRLKSDVSTVFTVKPIYSNGNHGWIQKSIPGDNTWHTYTYELVESKYQGATLNKIYFYFDGGSTTPSSGTISIDEFQIAGLSVSVTELLAEVQDSVTVALNWSSSDPAHVQHYNVYRGLDDAFSPAPENLVAQPTDTFLVDTGLEEQTTYYYKVSATDTDDREHGPSQVSIRTRTPGSAPTPVVVSENIHPVGLNDKYELLIDMSDADYDNPYDPDQIDLRAVFTAPDGQSTTIFGFYDNYNGADQWKIRFAANLVGDWTCRILAKDADGEGSSDVHEFKVVDSDNSGHLSISDSNPDYLETSDGNMFYPVAVYYPWFVTESGLDKLASTGCNMFGYWDCDWDGDGNGGGRYLMESKNSGLGRMDQHMAARLDEIITWAEDRDMKVMFAMWAHPFLRLDGEHWDGGRYQVSNPYSEHFSIQEFFSDSLAMAYQKKHYRYLLARYGYSTSLGTWEIINEMHGTSGWIRNEDMCKTWVATVHDYFKENDPWQRPTTASFGGNTGASHHFEGDKLGDMPNVHFYELHGWGNPYPSNLVRSGLTNLVNEAKKMKSKGRRPAFLGEAGYDHMLAAHTTEAYTWELHNCLWGGLANGLASTPFWWDYTSRTGSSKEILTDERMEHYTVFGQFVEDLNFPLPMEQGKVHMEGADAYFRGGQDVGVGWAYAYEDTAISNATQYIAGTTMKNGTYHLEWFDTWVGGSPGTEKVIFVDGCSWNTVPASVVNQDIAYKLSPLDGWQSAANVNLQLIKVDTILPGFIPGLPGELKTLLRIACYVTDEQGMLDAGYSGEVQITIEGSAEPGTSTLQLSEGGKVFDYVDPEQVGATVTATIDGLGTATLQIPGVVGTGPGTHAGQGSNSLSKIYPNPAQGNCQLEFCLAETQDIRLAVYTAHGQLVEILEQGSRDKGSYKLNWKADDISAGLYFIRLSGRDFQAVEKLVVER